MKINLKTKTKGYLKMRLDHLLLNLFNFSNFSMTDTGAYCAMLIMDALVKLLIDLLWGSSHFSVHPIICCG